MANVTKPIMLDETGQAIVDKLDAIKDAMAPATADDILTSAITGIDNVEDALSYLKDEIDTAESGNVKSVNAIHPDENGEVRITNVAYADNLTSDKTQDSEDEFIIRTAGGDASISDGDAFAMRVYGNRVHTGYSPESLTTEVTMTPRVAPDPITASLDEATFEAYVEEAGTYVLNYTNGSWSADVSLYGVTVSGTPFNGDSITIFWDGENNADVTVYAPRTAPDGISATINRDTFVGYVSESGVITLTYSTIWDKNPANYGVTVTGTPISGDVITITYYKEERGTIAVATPTALKSTWWNLYNHAVGYAYLTKYSEEYGFRIGGAYSALEYSATLSGTKTTVTPVDGVFTIPADGYVWVTGGSSTTTYIINQWSDWTDGPAGEFEAYSESTVDLSTVMSTYFPNGLLRVGQIRDEININASQAISKIERKAYTAENLAAAKASGRAYEYDTNYIYIVKAAYDSNAITVDGEYLASDHGNEFFVGSSVPVYLSTMYGNNLKNKLERDVVTISQQTLTSAQQEQVRENLGAASEADITTLNSSKANVAGIAGAFHNASSLDDVKQLFITEMGNTSYNNVRYIVIHFQNAIPEFPGGGTWSCMITKTNQNYWNVYCNYMTGVHNRNGGETVYVSYDDGTWVFTNLIVPRFQTELVPKESASYTYAGVRFSRFGSTISVFVNGLVNLPNGSSDICTIPNGFIPDSSYSYDLIAANDNSGSGLRVLRFNISTSKKLTVYNYGSAMSNNNANCNMVFVVREVK